VTRIILRGDSSADRVREIVEAYLIERSGWYGLTENFRWSLATSDVEQLPSDGPATILIEAHLDGLPGSEHPIASQGGRIPTLALMIRLVVTPLSQRRVEVEVQLESGPPEVEEFLAGLVVALRAVCPETTEQATDSPSN
jgi:hypothetical protein